MLAALLAEDTKPETLRKMLASFRDPAGLSRPGSRASSRSG